MHADTVRSIRTPGRRRIGTPPTLRAALLAGSALGLALAAAPAQAGPTGGSVSSGSATIAVPDASTTVVDQTTPRAVIDWSTYNVDAGETVRYQHENTTDATLNVINDSNPSEIRGRIESRIGATDQLGGTVILYNGNGIAFSNTAVVDVGSLIATSLPPDIDAFRTQGHVVLDGTTPAGHNAGAVVSNAGQITVADRGLAALVAPRVENSGLIRARLGSVQLASASRGALVGTTGTPIDINTVDRTDTTIDFYGDGLVQFRVSRGSEAADQLIRHTETGTIDAQGGTVLMTADAAADLVNTAINLDGVVLAAGAAASAGQVAMVGEGDIVFGSQSLVEAGDGSVWIDSTADVTQADGSAILTRDLAARGAKVALTSYDNYAERLAGRAQEGVNVDDDPLGRADFRFHQSNATGDAPEIVPFSDPIVSPMTGEEMAGIGLDIIVVGDEDGRVRWSFVGDHQFNRLEFAALTYSFEGLPWTAADYDAADSSDFYVGPLSFGGTPIVPGAPLPPGVTVTAEGGPLIVDGSRWGIDGDLNEGPRGQLQYNTLDPDGPVSETLLVTLGESVQSADGVLTNHFGPDTPLGANRGIERARVTLVDGTQGAAELYTDTRVAEITVTANDATRPAGSPNPDFTATIDPDGTFQPDGTARRDWRVDRGNLTFDTEADLLSPVGDYSITPGGLTPSARFRTIYVDGVLTVTDAPPPPPPEPPPEPPQPPEQSPAAGPVANPFQFANLIRTPERGRDPDTPGDAVYRTTQYENPFIPDPRGRSYGLGVAAIGPAAPEQLAEIAPAAGPDGEPVLPFGGPLNDTTGQHATRPETPVAGGSPVNLAGLTDPNLALEAIAPAGGGTGAAPAQTAAADAVFCSASEFLADYWQCLDISTTE